MPRMRKAVLFIVIALVVALVIFSAGKKQEKTAGWKLNKKSADAYAELDTPEKHLAENWLANLPEGASRSEFTQLVRGLALWVNDYPATFVDFEFEKLFSSKGNVEGPFMLKAADASISIGRYTPPYDEHEGEETHDT